MTTVELLNLGLSKLGISEGILSVNDASIEATLGARTYDHALRLALRMFPWSFATKYAEPINNPLLLVGGPLWNSDPATLTAVQAWSETAGYRFGDVVRFADVNYTCVLKHTPSHSPPDATYWSTTPGTTTYNSDWRYAYRWPDDCLFARRLVNTAVGRKFDRDPYPFRVGRDSNGLLILTNTPEAILEYTSLDCGALWVDDVWIEAFAWMVAYALAPSLSRNGTTADKCLQMYSLWAEQARALSANESQQEQPGDADWITGRN